MARSIRNRSTRPCPGSSPRLSAAFALVLSLITLTLTLGCTPQTEPRVAQETTTPAAAPPTKRPQANTAAPPPTAGVGSSYKLGTTSLTIEVGKAGRLARLGHNHIVHSTAVSGRLTIDANDQLEADLFVPVTSLLVDDAEQRSIHRARDPQSYSSEPTTQQIASTRANMLSQRVLNAEAHGFLQARVTAEDPAFTQTLRGTNLAVENHQTPVVLELQIAGSEATVKCDIHWRSSGDRIEWKTQFSVTHQELGLTPFSALAGALRVAPELKLTLTGEINLDATPAAN